MLIPGAGGSAWYWHRVVPELEDRGFETIAVELPAADDSAGLAEYTRTVVDAIGDIGSVVIVAQSLGGLTAPLVCDQVPVDLLVLVNAMVPQSGETGGEWWANTGQVEAAARYASEQGRDIEFDPIEDFFHDVPHDVREKAFRIGEPLQSGTPFEEPWPLLTWPAVPTRVVAGREDRLFPAEFQVRVARQRLGSPTEVIPGGHLVALSQPVELADLLSNYVEETSGSNADS